MKIAGRGVRDGRVAASTGGASAEVFRTLIFIVAYDALAEHRVFAYAGHAYPGEPLNAAGCVRSNRRIAATSIRRVAAIFGALVVVVAYDPLTERCVFAHAGLA